jgi:hypothetical protein
MGSKNLIFILILIPVALYAQEKPDFVTTDSLTYKYYESGEWEKLIKYGNNAIASGVDYKFLRQRLGFAYFMKGDYYESRSQFEKAFESDSYNDFTLEYLYYTSLNTGKEELAGVIAKRMNPDLRKKLSLRSFTPFESIELEYNFRLSGTVLRSNAQYFRLGINTQLNNRLNLFQSVSDFTQTLNLKQSGSVDADIRQPEYYALLTWNASRRLMLSSAYHYIRVRSGNLIFTGNLINLSLAADYNRLTFEADGSIMKLVDYVYQAGVQCGYVFPGKPDFFVKMKASYLAQSGYGNFIYNPIAGFKLFKNVWMEGKATFGNMHGYNDFNGLYVYNTYDPVVFKSGAGVTWYTRKKISFWLNYNFEKKEFFEDNTFTYNQYSYLGGIKWEL